MSDNTTDNPEKPLNADVPVQRPRSMPKKQKGVATDQKPEVTSPLGNVVIRNQFYRDGYRTLVKVALIQGLAILGLILTYIVFLNTYTPTRTYFATTEDGRVVPMIPLSQANLSKPALLSWAAQAASETMTFGFHDYRRRLQESSRHFTRGGWGSFTRALQESGMIETITTNRQVISTAPRSAPTILAEGLMPNGVYRWEVEMPILVTYELGQSRRSDSMNIRLVIVRVPKLESANGVGIEQWLAYKG
jgi:intracellular multiplication protein IcmL